MLPDLVASHANIVSLLLGSSWTATDLLNHRKTFVCLGGDYQQAVVLYKIILPPLIHLPAPSSILIEFSPE